MSQLLERANSFLFVPASRPERLAKALATDADMVIADWEDAVSPQDKDAARLALLAAVAELDAASRARLLVRINPVGTPWHEADVQALRTLVHAGIAGACVPKSESGAALAHIVRIAGADCAMLALVESVAGLDAIDEIAKAAQVRRIAFGHLDFQVDARMRCAADEMELLPIRMQIVLASRRAGIAQPVDGVTVDTRDESRIRSDSERAQRMGFGGKLCIHPAQVAVVNGVYEPSSAEVEFAQKVQRAMQEAHGGVCVVDGRMIDAPVLHLAGQTLERHAWARQRAASAAN